MADPRVISCIRSDHRQVIHLLQLCSSMSTWGQLEDFERQSKATRPRNHQKASPLLSQASRITGLINSTWDNPVNHQRGLLERRANCVRSSLLSTSHKPTQRKKGLLREASNSSPPFSPLTLRRKKDLLERRAPLSIHQRSEAIKEPTSKARETHVPPLSTHSEQKAYSDTLQGPLSEQDKWPFKFLSALSPYSRKPGLFGPDVSICAKGVSRGVHNIAFLLSPDDFHCNWLGFSQGCLGALWAIITTQSKVKGMVCWLDHSGLQQPSSSL